MGMFEQIREFTPDSLRASPDFPILKRGIGLKPGQGVLKRGSLILKGTDKAGYIAGGSVAGEGAQVCGILTDDTDTGSSAGAQASDTPGVDTDTVDGISEDIPGGNIPATVYMTGVFNPAAILLSGEDADISTYEKELKDAGIYLRSVQEYEGR